MAKRKPTIAERQTRKKNQEERQFLRLYARYCYLRSVKARAKEAGVPWGAIVPRRSVRNEMVSRAEIKAREFLDGLPHQAMRRRALERMGKEMEGANLSWR